MNLSCEVIRDLLPLYAEEMLSDESTRLVEAHLQGCSACAEMLEEMKRPLEETPKPPVSDLRGFRKRVIQWLIAGLMAAIFFAITLVVWGGAGLLRQEALPLEKAVVSVTEAEGAVIVELTPTAADNFTWYSEETLRGTRQQYLVGVKPVMDWFFRNSSTEETVKVTMRNTSSVWYYDQGQLVCLYGDEEPVWPDWGKDPVLVPALIFGAIMALLAVLLRKKWLRYTAVMSFAFILAERMLSDGRWTSFRGAEVITILFLMILAGLLTGSIAIVWEFISGAAAREL